MKKVSIGLIGAGTVGSGLIKILSESKEKIASRSGIELNLKSVCDVNLAQLKEILPSHILTTTKYQDITESKDIDLVVELVGGTGIAYQIVKSAIENKKTVVTANKALLSEKGVELFELAEKNQVEIGLEASVGGAIPVIRSVRTGMVSNEFLSIYGILNGTTNFILTKMELENLEYSTALKMAQELGFAEQDPTFDVEGLDAAHKISLLGGLAFDKKIFTKDMYIEGITNISKTDIQFARSLGYRIKLLGVCKNQNGQIEARVHPTMVPLNHPLSSVMNEMNAVYFETSNSGPSMFLGKGAGSLPTASAVVSDLVFYGARRNLNLFEKNTFESVQVQDMDEVKDRYYFRFNTLDKPGVLAEIAQILGSNNISILSVLQNEAVKEPVEVIVITHTAREKDIRKSIEQIDQLSIIKEKTTIIRLENIK